MPIKRMLLSFLSSFLSLFIIACLPQVEVTDDIEDMKKEDFAEIAENVKTIDVFDYKKHKVCSISSSNDVIEIIDILSNIYPISGVQETEGNSFFLLMYNESNDLICYISLWHKGYLGFGEIVEKEYALDIEYVNALEVLFD